jgi:hypothetical protein
LTALAAISVIRLLDMGELRARPCCEPQISHEVRERKLMHRIGALIEASHNGVQTFKVKFLSGPWD